MKKYIILLAIISGLLAAEVKIAEAQSAYNYQSTVIKYNPLYIPNRSSSTLKSDRDRKEARSKRERQQYKKDREERERNGEEERIISWINNGNNNLGKGRYNQAIADYNKVLSKQANGTAQYNRGLAYYYKKQYKLALNDLTNAQGMGIEVDQNLLNEVKNNLGNN